MLTGGQTTIHLTSNPSLVSNQQVSAQKEDLPPLLLLHFSFKIFSSSRPAQPWPFFSALLKSTETALLAID